MFSRLKELDYSSNNFFCQAIDRRVLDLCESACQNSKETSKNLFQTNHIQNEIKLKDRPFIPNQVQLTGSTHFKSTNNEEINSNFFQSNFKDQLSSDINNLNLINTQFSKGFDYPNLNKKQAQEKSESENVPQKVEESIGKIVFSNPDYKGTSNKYFVNGIKINSRKRVASSIEKAEKINLKNEKEQAINFSLEKQKGSLAYIGIKEIIQNRKRFDPSNYYTKSKYKDCYKDMDCYNCKLKERINKKFEVHFKERFKSTDQDQSKLIVQAKQLLIKKQYKACYDLISDFMMTKQKNNEDYSSDVLYLLGQTLYLLKEFKISEEVFYECLRYETFNEMVFYYLGEILLRNGEIDDSLAMVSTLMKKLSKHPDSYFLLSKIQYETQSYVQSLDSINRAIKYLEDEHEGNLYIIKKNSEIIVKYYSQRQKVYRILELHDEEERDIEFLKQFESSESYFK